MEPHYNLSLTLTDATLQDGLDGKDVSVPHRARSAD